MCRFTNRLSRKLTPAPFFSNLRGETRKQKTVSPGKRAVAWKTGHVQCEHMGNFFRKWSILRRVPRRPGCAKLLLWVLVILSLGLSGCQSAPERQTKPSPSGPATVRFQGQSFLLFDNAWHQLAWSQSLRDNLPRQRDALRLLLERFADNRPVCGHARLALAFLTLGSDYRLAPPARCRQALAALENIEKTYSDIPELAAKALWYQGWILTDLLQATQPGLQRYRRLLRQFPGAPLQEDTAAVPIPPILFTPAENSPRSAQNNILWTDLAWIEICRYSNDQGELARGLDILAKQQNGRLYGLAILQLLQRNPILPTAIEQARLYLRQEQAETFIRQDIRRRLQTLHSRP